MCWFKKQLSYCQLLKNVVKLVASLLVVNHSPTLSMTQDQTEQLQWRASNLTVAYLSKLTSCRHSYTREAGEGDTSECLFDLEMIFGHWAVRR